MTRRRWNSFPTPRCPTRRSPRRRRIVAAARLDVGGIEYLETPGGRRVFYDINANSNLRPSVAQAFGFDPFERVVDFLQTQIAKQLAAVSASKPLCFRSYGISERIGMNGRERPRDS